MIDYLLATVVILVLVLSLGFIYLKDRQHDKQINQLIKAVISKTPQDYRDLTLSENTKIDLKEPGGEIQNDYVPMSEADPALFDKMIKNQLNDEDTLLDES